jgi:hypothetical protein
VSLFSCKEMVRLASDAFDRDLTLGQRVALYTHLAMCRACARFRKHLRFLHNAAGRLDDLDAGDAVDLAVLSDAARERMQRALERYNDERSHNVDPEP